MNYQHLVEVPATGPFDEPMNRYLQGEYPLKVTTMPDLGIFAFFDLIAERLER